MKIIIKNIFIVLRRFGASSILAVIGLAIAYCIFYMAVVQSFYDLRFDRNFEKADSIFLYSRITPTSIQMGGDFRVITNTVEPRECAERYPEIKNFCYLTIRNDKRFDITDEKTGKQRIIYETFTSASIGLFDMFKLKVLHGDLKQAFTSQYVMLTESTAKKMFGNEYPVGKQISYYDYINVDQLIVATVAAVCADFPANCSLKNGVYQYQPEIAHSQWGYTTYFEIDPSNRDKLVKKMNDEQYMQKAEGKENENWQYELTALPKVHLWFPAKGEGNPVTVIALLSVGILLLVISYINFLNFSVAMAPVRARNINIRKIFGESLFMLKISVIMEAVFLSFISFLLSIFLIQFLNTGALKDFFIADLSITKNQGLALFAGVVSILSGFLAGIYPAFYTTAFNPAMALSGVFSLSSRNKWLKNISTSLQFIAAIFLITVTLFVKFQYDFMRNKDWGIQTKNILYVNTESIRDNIDSFMNELKQNSNIVDITVSDNYPGRQEGMQSWGREFEDVAIMINIWYVKPDFFNLTKKSTSFGGGDVL